MSSSRPPKWPSIPYYPHSPSLPDGAEVIQNSRPFWGNRSEPVKHQMNDIYIMEKLDGLSVCLYDGEVYLRDMSSHPAHHEYLAMAYKHHAWKTKGNKYAVWGGGFVCTTFN